MMICHSGRSLLLHSFQINSHSLCKNLMITTQYLQQNANEQRSVQPAYLISN